MNLDDEKEFIKLLKILKSNIKVVVVENKIDIYYERTNLYESIVFSNTETQEIYKKIISTLGDNEIQVEFDNYLLPIGSVVKLNTNQTILIIARVIEVDDEVYEYIGCDNKTGYDLNKLVNFNHKNITKIYSLPYEDANTIATTISIKKQLDSLEEK